MLHKPTLQETIIFTEDFYIKLNQVTKALAAAVALLGMVQAQAKPEIYVTENNSAPIEYVDTMPSQEQDKYEVEQVYVPRKGRASKKLYRTTRYIVKESSTVTMGDATNAVVYTAGVGTLAYFTFGLISTVFFSAATALSLLQTNKPLN